MEKRSHGSIKNEKLTHRRSSGTKIKNSAVSKNKEHSKELALKEQKRIEVEENKIEEPEIAQVEPEIKQKVVLKSDGGLEERENELIVEEFKQEFAPPELQDGEVLRKTKNKSDALGLASGIIGYTALGIFLLTLLITIILAILVAVGSLSGAITGIVLNFMYFGSFVMGVVALVLGSISYSKKRNGMALAGIIIGAIFALFLLIGIIVVLVAI